MDKRLSDYDYVRKELLRNGVTKKLLWIEYCELCRQSGSQPLMYNRFADTFEGMSNKGAQPYTYRGNPESRSKPAGQATRIMYITEGKSTFHGLLAHPKRCISQLVMND